MILNKQFLSENAELVFGTEPEAVSLGEIGGEEAFVYVMGLNAGNAIEVFSEADENTDTRLVWVSACTVDENGNRVFEPSDVSKLPLTMYNKLWDVVARKNALVDSSKGVEEAEKNLEEVDS